MGFLSVLLSVTKLFLITAFHFSESGFLIVYLYVDSLRLRLLGYDNLIVYIPSRSKLDLMSSPKNQGYVEFISIIIF